MKSQNTSSSIRVDEKGRVHLGVLRTSSQQNAEGGKRYLEEIKKISLRPVIRIGKGNQWFAALEDNLGETIACSDDLGNEAAAREAAATALSLLKS